MKLHSEYYRLLGTEMTEVSVDAHKVSCSIGTEFHSGVNAIKEAISLNDDLKARVEALTSIAEILGITDFKHSTLVSVNVYAFVSQPVSTAMLRRSQRSPKKDCPCNERYYTSSVQKPALKSICMK